MKEKQQLELFILRYLPDVVRGEFVNIGAALVRKDGGISGTRFSHDSRRVLCLYPETDIMVLETLQRHLEMELRDAVSWKEFSRIFGNYVSSGFELSAAKGVETTDPAAELEIIDRYYLRVPRSKGVAKPTGRDVLILQMEKHFRNAGILKLLQARTLMAPYTWSTDTFRMDYLYRVDQGVRMFHAVPVARQSDTALALAYRYPKIVAGLTREQQKLVLTAIVEDALDETQDSVACALMALRETGIRVAPVGDMPRIAEEARIELRA